MLHNPRVVQSYLGLAGAAPRILTGGIVSRETSARCRRGQVST
ncbi:MAG: hypothetical protein WDN04_24090 [Rhodospirillales bacterium]